MKEIADAALKAEGFEPKLQAFYFACGTPRDGKLQRGVLLLSEQRASEKRFPVGILFWDDIYEDLVTNLIEFGKHYPQFVTPTIVDPIAFLKGQAASDKYRAAQEIHALFHDLTSGSSVRPDIPWEEVLEFVAWGFGSYEKKLDSILRTFGLILDDRVKRLLEEAQALCGDGKFGVQVTDDGPVVTPKSLELAERVHEVLKTAQAEVSASIKQAAETPR